MNYSIQHYKHPLKFYFPAILIPWVCWFLAGYISPLTPEKPYYDALVSGLEYLGWLSLVVIAYGIMTKDSDLKKDFFNRLFTIEFVKPNYMLLTCFLMLASILLAQAISVLLGYSREQFVITGQFTFSSGMFPVWALLSVAPLPEELARHYYGTDCLRNLFNLLNTSMLFACFWGLWHIPLTSIDNYYHSNVVETGWIHGVNFLVSLFPFVLIMNWLYYRTNRNIMIAVIFHITAGFINEIFATDPDSKIIQTGLLIVFSIYIVMNDKEFFLNLEYTTIPGFKYKEVTERAV